MSHRGCKLGTKRALAAGTASIRSHGPLASNSTCSASPNASGFLSSKPTSRGPWIRSGDWWYPGSTASDPKGAVTVVSCLRPTTSTEGSRTARPHRQSCCGLSTAFVVPHGRTLDRRQCPRRSTRMRPSRVSTTMSGTRTTATRSFLDRDDGFPRTPAAETRPTAHGAGGDCTPFVARVVVLRGSRPWRKPIR